MRLVLSYARVVVPHKKVIEFVLQRHDADLLAACSCPHASFTCSCSSQEVTASVADADADSAHLDQERRPESLQRRSPNGV
jgi:hypothetical protein